MLTVIKLLLLYLFTASRSKVVKHRFEVKYFSGSPDGVLKDNILGINGKFPCPMIEAEKGDTLEVEFVNQIQDGQASTLHWHGIHQRGTVFEDGTDLITQCPLKHKRTQIYKFNLTQTGTYWYHSHSHSQYTEGMWGVFIIRNPTEVYKYDGEFVITLNDWYHQGGHENQEWHLSLASKGEPPYPNSGMINGKGRYNCSYAELSNRTCSASKQLRSVFKVSPGKKIKIRVINTSAVAAFNFSIDGHTLETIEIDATDVATPVPSDAVVIAAAQRYVFLITTDKPVDRYLIRAYLRTDILMSKRGVNINKYIDAVQPEITAVLEYDPNLTRQPKTVVETKEVFEYFKTIPPINRTNLVFINESLLTAYDKEPAPSTFDQEFILNVHFGADHENIRRASFNKTPFFTPKEKPVLFYVMDNEPVPSASFPLEIGYMNSIQLVINNPFLGPHPFHLHGHHFWDMGTGEWGEGDYNPLVHKLNRNGMKRDTVFVQEKSWAVVRFIADNPGVWFFHCHVNWHHMSGMALVFIEAPEILRNTTKVPTEARKLCVKSKPTIFKILYT